MDDTTLLHYSRQIMLPEIGIEGQQRLLNSRVMLVGLGGLGSPAAMYLAAAGVGHLTIADFDTVDLSNLQRQIIHHIDSIGDFKVDSAQSTLKQLNPDCQVHPIAELMDETAMRQQIKQHDLVIDASDNFATRYMINRLCVLENKPLVSGAAIRWEGQISTFLNDGHSACYHCLYGDHGEEDESCTENGVLAPVVGIIGAMQATEAIKVLCNIGTLLSGRLMVLDALHLQWRTIKIKQDPDCTVCSTH